MSQWTHIRGGFELKADPFEKKPIKVEKVQRPKDPDKEPEQQAKFERWREAFVKSFYLPFPEEQFKVLPPTLGYRSKKNKDGTYDEDKGLSFQVYEYSLPRVRKYIDDAFKMLPQGECGWSYSINQTSCQSSSSTSCFDFPCEEKYFKQAITKMYAFDNPWQSRDYNLLKDYEKAELSWIEHVEGITIGIREDLRWCSGQELMNSLEAFFNHLAEKDIEVEDGYLEWEDEYDDEHIYAWRCSRMSDTSHEFLILDKKTNKIVHSRIYKYPLDEHGWIDWDAFEKDGFNIVEEDFE